MAANKWKAKPKAIFKDQEQTEVKICKSGEVDIVRTYSYNNRTKQELLQIIKSDLKKLNKGPVLTEQLVQMIDQEIDENDT